MSWVEVMVLLVAWHALADYPLQGDFVAQYKAPGSRLGGEAVWPWVMGAHCAIHAGGVLVITGVVWLALVEFVLHWWIDEAKCRGLHGFHVDQAAHLLCKVGYVLVFYGMGGV